jgi:hypothetical protein
LFAGDSFALSDAGVGGFEGEDNREGAVFYGAGCALYQDLFTDLVDLGGPPSPPPPPITPLDATNELTPVRIFFAQGMSPEMSQQLGSTTDRRSTDLADRPYRERQRRRELQSQDAADEAVEIIDSTNNPDVLRVCTQHTPDEDSLCEAAGYENSVRTCSLKRT